ncbi:tagatose-bisphosphate aldolase subunit GatZ [Acerihabitans arboris]|uniref:D-tagatose-1,6-bisphosphate aldolase subunit GatZ n=1 Tax=Acerihabitans arboris TaxID=2691583 RepID=A0A845SK33_9GAMM|nr:tagatose-bisphosphate aldolase subunit GatZ [Acerihabitans arboris]NDL64309.1 tagatose-bisphosphate aldolase subunit GatZ [Acerihabitans arboris]
MKGLIEKHKQGLDIGICSVCSAHPFVIEAALQFDLNNDRMVLIEATSNQVNQDGGYTGMKPADFRDYVLGIAEKVGFPKERLILGGDHLGPNCWQNEPAVQAMEKSRLLIAEYVKAGFSKIHLDASMSCADDPIPLPPETIATRAAELCRIAEEVATNEQKLALTYVIGTEVPVPGGEASSINEVHITRPEDAAHTINIHHEAFLKAGLKDAIKRIIGLVVQPGVEFDHSSVIHYDPTKASQLSRFIESTPIVFEAHSTDYQTPKAYRALVKDHFAILKVGPALTFALREAVFALAKIEQEMVFPEDQSQILAVIDQVMLDEPGYWKKYYRPEFTQALIDIHYSLSDRIRYYWPNSRISSALDKMLDNLSAANIPLGLLSQYFPKQFERVLAGTLPIEPRVLIIDKIQDVLRNYGYGCIPQSSIVKEVSNA